MNPSNKKDEVETPEEAKDAVRLLEEVRDIQHEQKLDQNDPVNPILTPDKIETEELLRADTLVYDLDTSWWSETGTDETSLPKTIGRFAIIRQLGFGGFARVFLARDPKLDRDVALKIPNFAAMMSADARERFSREARAAGILSHPSIVPVYENGNIGPVSYIVYEYCPGQTLADWIQQSNNEISPKNAAETVSRLADAVEHAHQRGVIHRDLKPANIMIEDGGLESNRIRITDFGLARQAEPDQLTVTAEGAIVGTPAYMSPEQAQGSKQIGKLTDVFSLGVILYELLTGKLPFKRENHLSTLRSIEIDVPVSPRRIRQAIPADLEAICLKCLEKRPEHRYESAFDLAEDLRAFSDGRPIAARRPGPVERFGRWCKRNPAVAAATTFAFVSLVGGLASTTWQWRNAVTNAKLASAATKKAIDARDDANAAKKEAVLSKDRAEAANLDSNAFANFLVDGVMSAAKPVGVQGGKGKDITVREMLIAMEAEIESDLSQRPVIEARARNAFGAAWRELGNYDKAAEHFMAVLDLKDELGELDHLTLQSTLEIGGILYQRGELAKARKLLESTYPIAKETLGEDHMLSIGYVNSLAAVLLRQGEFKPAVDLLKQLRNLFLEKSGPDDPTTQAITVNLAVAHREDGSDNEAIRLLHEQLDRQLNSLGKQNYQTLRTMTELAESLNFANRADEGTEILDQALPLAKSLFGDSHPKTIETMLYKARNLQRIGNMPAAIKLGLETRTICESEFADYHPLTTQCILLLSQLYEDSEDFENHESVITELIALHRENGNVERELRRIPSLAKALLGLEKFEELKRLIQEQRPRLIEQFGESNVSTKALSSAGARMLEATEKWGEAAAEFESLVASHRSTMSDSPVAKKLLSNWLAGQANCLNELGEFEQAEKLAAESLEIRQLLDKDRPNTMEAQGILADSRIGQHKTETAILDLEESHDFIQEFYQARSSTVRRELLRQSCRRMIRMRKSLDQPEEVAALQQQFEKLKIEMRTPVEPD